MRKVLILGGGGMVGQKLAHHLAANGLNGDTDLDGDPVRRRVSGRGCRAGHGNHRRRYHRCGDGAGGWWRASRM